MAKGKVKVRVIMPHVLASAGGPPYAEGEVELEPDVAEAAEAMGGVEYVGKRPPRAAKDKPAAKKTTAIRRRRKATATKPAAGLTKADVPGAG